ncbi:hypothetical protein [Bacillus ndiopicus]|uniref:hypothetical protein n=1 Tax=Bacillus ndiopicus TaxID=1347368 RepID=UPI00069428C1|nr:hypothetical protein [Bacillus ndiopicus]
MKKHILLAVFALVMLFITACSDAQNDFSTVEKTIVIGNPTVEEVMELDPDADIFIWNNTVYKTHIDWVDALTLIEDELVGAIELNSATLSKFSNLAANKLPVGTEIYTATERNDILIAKHDDETKYYLMLVEG